MKVLITGASKGIGRGIATALARHGHHVVCLARNTELLATLHTEIVAAGGSCTAITADITDPYACNAAVEEMMATVGGIDALVNNAGLIVRKSVLEIHPSEWRAMFDTNVHGLFYMTRAVAPIMRDQGHGHIINISSISGRLPLPGGSGYAASKYAVSGFTESIFQELRDFGIKVTLVYPGSVDSASHRHDPTADTTWKVQPEEVGDALHAVLDTRAGNLISQLEIRPLNRPPKR